jgi:sugar lactone lactonase YvrE
MKPNATTHFYTPETLDQRFLPEGPLPIDPSAWHEAGNFMAWVSIQHGADSRQGAINILNLDTRENRSYLLPGRPGFIAQAEQPGSFLVGMEKELCLVDIRSGSPVVSGLGLQVESDPNTIINDGISTPFGAIFGTKDCRFEAPIGHLYLFRSSDQQLIDLGEGYTCSNGKIMQGATLFDIDTPRKKVQKYALDVEAGTLSAPEDFIDLTAEDHFPDGMRVTPDGQSLVIGFYNPHDVTRGLARQYSLSTGAPERAWAVEQSPRVTCPAFVEIDGTVQLVLTTAMEGMPEDQFAKNPAAGALFVAETAYPSLTVRPPLVRVTPPN